MDEWKVDEHGKRYREIAPGHIEFEPTIVVHTAVVNGHGCGAERPSCVA